MQFLHDFKETIREEALRDPAFREELLTESINLMLEGDFATGKEILRDYINATVGFYKQLISLIAALPFIIMV